MTGIAVQHETITAGYDGATAGRRAGRHGFVAATWACSFAFSLTVSQAAPPRPDLATAKPIAQCKLQTPAAPRQNDMTMASAMPYAVRPAVVDPLADYEPSSPSVEGAAGKVAAADPWLRLLLLGRNRPTIIDVAIFIDGKPFRAAREDWIDGLLANPASGGGKRLKAVIDTAIEQVTESVTAAIETNEAADDDKPKPETPGVATQARSAPSIQQRLANYMSAADAEVSREEIHWLVEQWGAGPALLMLAPSRSWEHASDAPLSGCLDRDADGVLSAPEIEQAAVRLMQADKDGDQVVAVDELRAIADGRAATPAAIGQRLLTVLDESTDWPELTATLRRLYDDGGVNGAAAAELLSTNADLSLRVDLATSEPGKGGVALLTVSDDIAEVAGAVKATTDAVTVALDGEYLEFSAAGLVGSSDANGVSSQVAVGAVVSGQPLLAMLDADGDQRLTERERRTLGDVLASLDANGDRQISGDEIPMPIRVGITLGPHIHTLLDAPSRGFRPTKPPKQAEPPSWFASMDRNGDRDLSREEFLGASEQFRDFDADGDGLVSVSEAIKREQVAK